MSSSHTAPDRSYSIRDLARRWGVSVAKVLTFVRRGELVAVNLAADVARRPQYRIAPAEVERFERRRSSAPAPKPARRRRLVGAVDFYPD